MTASSRDSLVQAALRLMVERGFAATTVDEICHAAGVSKGAFFHHFKTKDDAAHAAIQSFVDATVAWQKTAPGADAPDPLERAFAFVDHNIRFVETTPPDPFGCILGNAAAELSQTRPELRRAAADGMRKWTRPLAEALQAAAQARQLPVDSAALADHFSAAFQGGIVLARAHNDPTLLVRSLQHYRRYLDMTLRPQTQRKNTP